VYCSDEEAFKSDGNDVDQIATRASRVTLPRPVSWRKAQEAVFRNLPPWRLEKRDNGVSWSAWTINWFISFFEKIWKHRNDTQFGVTPEQVLLQRTKLADRGIRRLYRVGRLLSDVERQPFQLSLTAMLAQPIASKESWVQQTDRRMPSALWRDKRRAKYNWSAITAYFQLQVPELQA